MGFFANLIATIASDAESIAKLSAPKPHIRPKATPSTKPAKPHIRPKAKPPVKPVAPKPARQRQRQRPKRTGKLADLFYIEELNDIDWIDPNMDGTDALVARLDELHVTRR